MGRVLGDVEWKAVLKEAGEKGGKGKQRLGEVKDKVKAALKVMMKDEDMDVKYYAKLAKEGGGVGSERDVKEKWGEDET